MVRSQFQQRQRLSPLLRDPLERGRILIKLEDCKSRYRCIVKRISAFEQKAGKIAREWVHCRAHRCI